MSFADDVWTNLAANLASALIARTASRLRDLAFGDPEQRALRRAWERAFMAMAQAVAADLDADRAGLVEDLFRAFVQAEGVADALIDLALAGRDPPLALLHERFEALEFDRDTLPVDFDAALAALTRGLADALLEEAGRPGSPLYNRASVVRAAAIHHLLGQQGRDLRQVARAVSRLEGQLGEARYHLVFLGPVSGVAVGDQATAQLAADQQALWEDVRQLLSELAASRRPPSHPAAGQIDPAHVAAYLKVVRTRCGRAETRPYRQLSELRGAPPSLSLLGEGGRAGVYVPLRFDLHPSRADMAAWPDGEQPSPGDRLRQQVERDLSRTDIDLRDVLAVPGHLVLIGAAGSGKTTVLRLVAAVLAAQDAALARAELGLQADPLPLPVVLALRDFENACQEKPRRYRRDVESLLRFLDDDFQRWHTGCAPAGFLGRLVRSGRAWLLLDALDEVADFDHRIAVRQAIERLADDFPANRLIVTARVAAYGDANSRLDERFHLATVRDLTRAQWQPIVERLYAGFEADPGVAAGRARRLVARIDGAPLLQEMVKTPLMAWTATLIHYADRELPEQRAELYNAYVDVLLGERLHEEESAEAAQRLREARWPMEDRRLYLTHAAYQAHDLAAGEGGSRGPKERALVIVDEHDLVRRILAPFMATYLGLERRQAEREAQDFLALMAERSGLLYAHQGGYTFGDHLTVQEFLAANYLVDNVRGTPDWLPFLQERAGQSWWQEVFLLVAGYLLQWPQQAQRYLLQELGRLPEEGDRGGRPAPDARAYGLAWAGRALLEIPPQRVGWHDHAGDELARRMAGVLWQNPPRTSVAARAEVGDVLGRLGDPRFEGPFRLPEFIVIPGGRSWIGSTEAEVERLVQETGKYYKNESPRHQVELAPFALARYPTTNAMYDCFLEAGGYADARWWSEAKEAGVWRPDGTVKDWFGKVRDRPVYRDDARFNGPNQPAVGVTWYEAVAYCRWLTAALDDGHTYRLPAEAEWERAARGALPSPGVRPGQGEGSGSGVEGCYPWGDDWQAGRANTEELGLGRTTPVGIFPDGASPAGLLDMAGNVWEWCADWYDEGIYRRRAGRVERNPRGPQGGISRVLRGGSWYQDHNLVRCACRRRSVPDDRILVYGFRVARGSPS